MIRKILVTASAALACVALASCSAIQDALDSSDGPDRDDAGQITEAADIGVMSMKAGDCFNSADLGTMISEVPGVPCSEPHDAEVTLVYNSPAASYQDMDAEAQESCEAAMADYVGANWESYEPMIEWSLIAPTSGGWAQGDHEIICIAYANGPDLTESLKDVAG